MSDSSLGSKLMCLILLLLSLLNLFDVDNMLPDRNQYEWNKLSLGRREHTLLHTTPSIPIVVIRPQLQILQSNKYKQIEYSLRW
jgi:hypothetical protein